MILYRDHRGQATHGGAARQHLRPGFRRASQLIEAILAIAIFAIFMGGIGLSLVLGERTTIAGGDRARASFLAEQQLEALRQMQITNFASLTPGTRGLKAQSTGWAFSGSQVISNGYSSNVTLTSIATDRVGVVSTVSWNFGRSRSGSVVLTSELTNWRKIATVGNWATLTKSAQLDASGTSPDYQQIAVSGNYAFVTGKRVSGTRGLYIFDITTPSSPVRVATSFDLGAAAYGVTIAGNRLYLATDDPVKEVQVYDITSPTTLATTDLVNSFDITVTGGARSIAVYGTTIFVGTVDDAVHHQFYAIEMSEIGPMTQLDSLNLTGSVLDLHLQDGYAYAAVSDNAGELKVVDLFDAENLSFAPGVGIDLSNSQDAVAVHLTGTSALIGRVVGSGIDELTLYSIADAPVPEPPPGPWSWDIGGDALAITGVYGNKYLFVGGNASSAQLRVLDLYLFAAGANPVLRTINVGATVRGVWHDIYKDRLFVITPSSFIVYAPG